MGLDSWSTSGSSPLFNNATEVHQCQAFTTVSGQTKYQSAYNVPQYVGSVVQFSSILKFLNGSGFIKNSDGSITLDSAPVANLQGIIPGLQAVTINTYDQSSVNGLSNANTATTQVFYGDIATITNNYYIAPNATGIAISLVNNISGLVCDLTWVQLACSDANGNALTFQPTGTPLYHANLSGFTTVAASAAQGANTIVVYQPAAANTFQPGDYIYLNPGQSNQELVQFNNLSLVQNGTGLITINSNFNFSHFVNETIYASVRGFYMKQVTPINAAGGIATAYYNISYNIQATQVGR